MKGSMNEEVLIDRPDAVAALVFYVNVGAIPPDRVDSFLRKFEEIVFNETNQVRAKVPENVAVFFLPVRNQDTYVDFLPFSISEEELDEIGEDCADFVHEVEMMTKGECEEKMCCQQKEKTFLNTVRGWCQNVFGKGCCRGK
jgi:hypothetical protein